MIDGHIQYNGGWKFFLSLQPGMRCEFADHRTCKERSAAYEAGLDATGRAALEQQQKHAAAQLDAAADRAAVAAEQEILNEAGRRKHEATRQNGIVKEKAIAAADSVLAAKLAEIDAAHERTTHEALKEHNKVSDAAINAWTAKRDEINTVDFLSQVRKESEAQLEPTPAPEVKTETTPALEVKTETTPAPEVKTETTPEA